MVDTFSTLADLSEQLNYKTDNLNTVIAAFNDKLARLNLGIEVWISDPLERKNVRQENRGTMCWVADLTLLGYCRADESWQIAVKSVTRVEHAEGGGIREELVGQGFPQPLLRASRENRLAATAKLPHLLSELEAKARVLLASIQQAEEMAGHLAPTNSVAASFRSALQMLFEEGMKTGGNSLEVNAGELHRIVGGYPAPNHKMPVCCSVMRSAMIDGDVIVAEPPSGRGASLTIRYQFPRP